MSTTKRIAFGTAAAGFSRIVSIVLGLVLMPVLFRHLPKEELGVWLLLGQSWAAMGILDLGFGVILTRRIALAKGKSGSDPNAILTPESLSEIADLVECGRRIYRMMAGGVFAVSWIVGVIYLRGLEFQGLNHTTVWIAWTIVCACQAVNVWATVWTCLLQGVGYVGWDALISSLINAATLVGQIIAVLCGGGLVALATIATAGAICQRALTYQFARRRRPELFSLCGHWNSALARGMKGPAIRAWLTAVGTVLVFNTDQFFIVSAAGEEGIPAFRAAYVFVHNITILAVSVSVASAVFISHSWQAGDMPQVHRMVERNCRLGLLVMLCSCAFAMTAGESLFNLWLGHGNFIGYPILGVFLLYETLEAQSYIISLSSRATDDEAFAYSSLGAGVLKIILALILVRFLGLLGLALATLLALVFTNHWYTVFRGLNRLQLPFPAYLKDVVLPVILSAFAALALALAAVAMMGHVTDLVRMMVSALAVGVVFVLAFCLIVLSSDERAGVRRRFFALATRFLPAR